MKITIIHFKQKEIREQLRTALVQNTSEQVRYTDTTIINIQ